jgi:ketosteroid isomerase-like protein
LRPQTSEPICIIVILTQGNVAIVRGAYEAFKKGEVEELMSLTTPDFVLKASAATDGAEHHGPQAMEEIFVAIRARWDEFRLEPLEFYEEGDCVLVLGTLVTKGPQEGMASTAGQLWTLKDGKVASMEAFLDSEEAIRAAGLTRLLT